MDTYTLCVPTYTYMYAKGIRVEVLILYFDPRRRLGRELAKKTGSFFLAKFRLRGRFGGRPRHTYVRVHIYIYIYAYLHTRVYT